MRRCDIVCPVVVGYGLSTPSTVQLFCHLVVHPELSIVCSA